MRPVRELYLRKCAIYLKIEREAKQLDGGSGGTEQEERLSCKSRSIGPKHTV